MKIKNKITEKFKNFTGKFSSFTQNVIFGLKILSKCAMLEITLYFICYITCNLTRVFEAYALKEIINNIIAISSDSENAVQRMLMWIIIYIILLMVSYIGWSFVNYFSEAVSKKSNRFVDEILIEKITLRDLAFFDDPEENNVLKIVNDNQWLVSQISWGVIGMISNMISMIAVLGIMLSFSPLMTLIVAVSVIPTIIQTDKYNNFLWNYDWQKSTDYKKTWYYQNLLRFKEYGEETRLYNNAEYYKKIFFDAWESWKNEKTKLAVKHNLKLFLTFLLQIGAIMITFVYSMLRFAAGKIGLGDIQYYVTVADQVKYNMESFLSGIANLQLESEKITVIRKFYDKKPEMQTNGTEIVNRQRIPEIEFRGVGFKYPKTDKWILRNFSFTIKSGEKIALVGLNGAGKSTVIKLLLRFYDPDEGEILFDGINARDYNLKSLRGTFGAMFQDYITYSMTLRENIILSDYEFASTPEAEQRIKEALEFSGADKLAETFEKGLDAEITRRFDEKGTEVSGGQKQKIALSRAYFHDSSIMILDEPSASLDPEAENEIFTKFIDLWKDRGAILISHRLSNVMLCDRIIVIEDGKTEESGSHFELMKADKKYASLFRLQAGKYMI